MPKGSQTITEDLRDLGLTMSAPGVVKTEMKSAAYTPDELRFFTSDLVAQSGYTMAEACRNCGLGGGINYQMAKNEVGERGIGTMRRILEGIGYETHLLVYVKRIDDHAQREGKDPDLTRRVRKRKNRRKKKLSKKYGRHAAVAEALIVDDGQSVLGDQLVKARLLEFNEQDALSDILNDEQES